MRACRSDHLPPDGRAVSRFHKKPAGAAWLYVPRWGPRPLESDGGAGAEGRWVVVTGNGRLHGQLLEGLMRRHHRVSHALPGEPLEVGQHIGPLRILYLGAFDEGGSGEDPTVAMARCQAAYLDLLSLGRTLARGGQSVDVRVVVLTNGLFDVSGEETLVPAEAILLAPCLVIPQELAGLSCRVVDIVPGEWANHPGYLVEQIEAEVAHRGAEPWVSYRGRRRWAQSFDPLPPTTVGDGTRLREGGVYLVIGGLGEIGSHLACWLAGRVRPKLILTGRRGLPPRGEWPARSAPGPEGDLLCRRMRRVQEMEALGAEVLVMRADVADERRMRRVFARAIERFGSVDGVFHAAGLSGPGLFRSIGDSTPEHTRAIFRAKVEGLQVLAQILPEEVGFCILLSSLSTVLGGVGRVDYVAANSYLDAFAGARNRERPGRWMSIDMDFWLSGELAAARGEAAAWADLAVTPAEGVRVFEHILAAPPIDRVAVSTFDLGERLKDLVRRRWYEQARSPAAHRVRSRGGLARPAQGSGVEDTLLGLWRELLGAEQIGVEDDFFDLGGDSLVALQMSKHLRRSFGVDLSMEQLLELPTVAALAAKIEACRPAGRGAWETSAEGPEPC